MKEETKTGMISGTGYINYTFPYWGPFVMKAKIDEPLISKLLEEGNKSREKNLDARKKLAGMIDNEYDYENYEEWFTPKFTSYISSYINALKDNWIPNHKPIKEWYSKSLWINYQKANEYNPPHKHSDDLSFVIYLQVPDEIKKENEAMQGVHNNVGPGMINFDYGEELPFSITGFNELPNTGDLFIFPAYLLHYVHAFKSDVERISVSGNIHLPDMHDGQMATNWSSDNAALNRHTDGEVTEGDQ